jgi:hypothetical protein
MGVSCMPSTQFLMLMIDVMTDATTDTTTDVQQTPQQVHNRCYDEHKTGT